MQEIAAEAGISAGAIYRYFASKEALLDAVHQDARKEVAGSFAGAAAAHPGSPLDALLEVGQHAIREGGDGDECALWLESVLAALRDPEAAGRHHRQMMEAIVADIESLLVNARSAGEVRADIDLHTVAVLCYAAAMGLKMLAAEGLALPVADEALAILCTGIRADGHTPGALPAHA